MNGSRMISLREDEKSGIIYRQWTSSSPQKGVLLLVHGLGAHSGRWEFISDFLSGKGISCYGLELRGFGATKDPQGHVDSFDIYFNDILRLYDIIRQKHPETKVFIAGESMGALIGYLMALQRPELFKGLICISPAIRSGLPFSFFDYMRIFFLLIFNPKSQLNMPFSSDMITRDTVYQKAMDANTLEHRLATPKMLLNIGLAQVRLKILKNRLKVPVLFLVAGDDSLVNTGSSKRFFRSLSVEDKELIEYPGMHHALSIEYGKEKVFEDISGWVLKRI